MQLFLLFKQVSHGEAHPTHLSISITKGEGQLLRQVKFSAIKRGAILALQDRHLLVSFTQVKHIGSHGRQVPLPGTETFEGQEERHVPLK